MRKVNKACLKMIEEHERMEMNVLYIEDKFAFDETMDVSSSKLSRGSEASSVVHMLESIMREHHDKNKKAKRYYGILQDTGLPAHKVLCRPNHLASSVSSVSLYHLQKQEQDWQKHAKLLRPLVPPQRRYCILPGANPLVFHPKEPPGSLNLSCPRPDLSDVVLGEKTVRLRMLYNSLMYTSWEEWNLTDSDGVLFEDCMWACELAVLVLKKGKKLWMAIFDDTLQELESTCVLPGIWANGTSDLQYANGQLFVVCGDGWLYSFDLEQYVMHCKRATTDAGTEFRARLEVACECMLNTFTVPAVGPIPEMYPFPGPFPEMFLIYECKIHMIVRLITLVNEGTYHECGVEFKKITKLMQSKTNYQMIVMDRGNMLAIFPQHVKKMYMLLNTTTMTTTIKLFPPRVRSNMVI